MHIESVQHSRTSTAPHLAEVRSREHSAEQAQCRTVERSARRACSHKSTCLHCSHVGLKTLACKSVVDKTLASPHSFDRSVVTMTSPHVLNDVFFKRALSSLPPTLLEAMISAELTDPGVLRLYPRYTSKELSIQGETHSATSVAGTSQRQSWQQRLQARFMSPIWRSLLLSRHSHLPLCLFLRLVLTAISRPMLQFPQHCL